MDPIIAYYNHINGLANCCSPSCCEGSAEQPHRFQTLYASDMPQAQYARFVTPRLTNIEPPPKRTKRRAFQPRRQVPSQSTPAPTDAGHDGMRTFWQDDEDNHQPQASRPRPLPSTTKPIDCVLDIAPPRADSSSPLTASSWSSECYLPVHYENEADVALITCHNNIRVEDGAWTINLFKKRPSTPLEEDIKEKEETRIFRSQDLLEDRLASNNEVMGKLDWTSTWVARLGV